MHLELLHIWQKCLLNPPGHFCLIWLFLIDIARLQVSLLSRAESDRDMNKTSGKANNFILFQKCSKKRKANHNLSFSSTPHLQSASFNKVLSPKRGNKNNVFIKLYRQRTFQNSVHTVVFKSLCYYHRKQDPPIFLFCANTRWLSYSCWLLSTFLLFNPLVKTWYWQFKEG